MGLQYTNEEYVDMVLVFVYGQGDGLYSVSRRTLKGFTIVQHLLLLREVFGKLVAMFVIVEGSVSCPWYVACFQMDIDTKYTFFYWEVAQETSEYQIYFNLPKVMEEHEYKFSTLTLRIF